MEIEAVPEANRVCPFKTNVLIRNSSKRQGEL